MSMQIPTMRSAAVRRALDHAAALEQPAPFAAARTDPVLGIVVVRPSRDVRREVALRLFDIVGMDARVPALHVVRALAGLRSSRSHQSLCQRVCSLAKSSSQSPIFAPHTAVSSRASLLRSSSSACFWASISSDTPIATVALPWKSHSRTRPRSWNQRYSPDATRSRYSISSDCVRPSKWSRIVRSTRSTSSGCSRSCHGRASRSHSSRWKPVIANHIALRSDTPLVMFQFQNAARAPQSAVASRDSFSCSDTSARLRASISMQIPAARSGRPSSSCSITWPRCSSHSQRESSVSTRNSASNDPLPPASSSSQDSR